MPHKQPRWLIFASVSSEVQADEDKDSIPSQLRDGEAYIKSIGGAVIDTLIVPGFSRDYWTWDEFAKAAAASKQKITAGVKMQKHWDARDFDGVWIRETSRVGRKQSIVNEFIGRTVESGAVIYTAMNGQTITRLDASVAGMVGAYTAEMEMKTFKARRKMGMEKRIERGLPAGEVPSTHVLIRDDKGNPLHLEVRPQARAFFTYAAVLLVGDPKHGIEPLPFNAAEERIASEGWALTGMKLGVSRLRNTIYKPHFWGHNAQYWYDRRGPSRTGMWMLEEGHAVPDGVRIIYNTHEPVLIGEISERLKRELHRRETVRGHARPLSATMFTGLIVCDECRCAVSRGHVSKYPGQSTYRCNTRFRPRLDISCEQNDAIQEKAIQAHINEKILEPLEHGDYSVLVPQDDTLAHQLADVENALAEEGERLERLIEGQSRSRGAAFEHYQSQIDRASDTLDALQRHANELKAQQHNTLTRRSSLEALLETAPTPLTDLWSLPTAEINQFLFALLGSMQFVFRDGAIIGLIPRRKASHGRPFP